MVRNDQLRQQLEESHRTNATLISELHKLTDEWKHLRVEIEHKEDELKEEEQVHKTVCVYEKPLKRNGPLTAAFAIFHFRHSTITTVRSRIA